MDDLTEIAVAHAKSMLFACTTALEAKGECAPMFVVLAPDGRSIAAGIFAGFSGWDEKVAKHRVLAEFAASQRAGAVVTCFDTFVNSRPLDEVKGGDPLMPSQDPAAHEALIVEVITAEGVLKNFPMFPYRRGDQGEILWDEPSSGIDAFGESIAVIVRALSTLGQKESRSTALRRLARAGFALLTDEDEARQLKRDIEIEGDGQWTEN